ncbi:WXG100 family type VII secretion target [Amycolatopsis regifaucium]|uniref:WXG100 family type VII secretion target n=1 Tax=Amycolatopsis regifaucium TaxID=546365 RepID=A0A154MWU4_9PSEU|nr:WXG100 family type VII secretion target [Amycolatopsis regifaucium]KZB88403.1 hypothetical protein AVL48_18585 [Amycolatopsis regifaucium]OKA04553.1 hypothetical protein ATP06_0231925 [Amycolatopsis regifaucium]
MADEFRLDPSGMQDMLSRLRSDNAEFSDAVTRLNQTLDRYHGCWGEDKAGKKFAEGYVDNANDVRTGLGDLSKGVGELADGVATTVGDFRDLDEANAKTFDHQLAEALQQQQQNAPKD